MLIQDRLKRYNLILASSSPRRRQLMKDAGFEFVVSARSGGDEYFPMDLSPEEAAVYVSRKKAEAYMPDVDDADVVITADTMVVVDNNILGKPINAEHAFDMLSLLSGRTHKVITGVTMLCGSRIRSFSETTEVKFKDLTHEEIDYYIENFRPLDKAGAYGAQEWIGYIGIEWMNGSYQNVVGLPIQRLCAELEIFMDAVEALR